MRKGLKSWEGILNRKVENPHPNDCWISYAPYPLGREKFPRLKRYLGKVG
jgi:hypothetical protein